MTKSRLANGYGLHKWIQKVFKSISALKKHNFRPLCRVPEHLVALLGQDLGQHLDVANELRVTDELIDGTEKSVLAGKLVPVLERDQLLKL